MQARYGPQSVEKQHRQARLYISDPQTLIKRSPKVYGIHPIMGCGIQPEMVLISKKKRSSPLSPQPVMPAATSGDYWPLLHSRFHVIFKDQLRRRGIRSEAQNPNTGHIWPAGRMFDTPVIGNQTVMFCF